MRWVLPIALLLSPLRASAALPVSTAAMNAQEALGAALFFDKSLSHGGTQSCASCHDPAAGFADPDRSAPTSKGADPTRFGSRNAPSIAYAAFRPAFHWNADDETWVGGQFLDGRAASLEAQAAQPFTNPIEMGLPDRAAVLDALRAGPNGDRFEALYGKSVWSDPALAFTRMTAAIAAFERTKVVSPFSSKFDAYTAGTARLTLRETRGLNIFDDPAKGNCAACHPSTPADGQAYALFTDFTYDNIGLPRNAASRFHDARATDFGLGATTGDPAQDGKFKVPTLRNIALTGPFGHNGWFDSLGQLVDFYATRDTRPRCTNPDVTAAQAVQMHCWPDAELPGTVNHDELGNVPLSARDKADLVGFLFTLSDGYAVAAPEPPPVLLLAAITAALLLGRAIRRSGQPA